MSADPYWNYVKLLCHFDGVDGSTRIVDERHNAASVSGNAKLSVLQSKFGGSALLLDGSGDLVSFPTTAPATSDFTIETAVFPRVTTQSYPLIWAVGTTAAGALMSGACYLFADHAAHPGRFSFFIGANSTTVPLLVGTSDIVYEQFSHVAVTRNNTTFTLWVNGVPEATATYSAAVATATTLNIGGTGSVNYDLFGYIDEFRYTLGMARYAADFTPPTEAFPGSGATDQHYGNVVLHCHFDGENDSTMFVDQKGHTLISEGVVPVKVTTARAKFGGVSAFGNTTTGGARINCGSSVDYVLGTGDFTIEGFVRIIGGTQYSRVFELRNAAGVEVLSLRTGRGYEYVPVVYVGGASAIEGVSIGTSAFFHLALVRQGSTLKLYSNGTQMGATHTIGTAGLNTDGTLYICGSPAVGFEGYVDEFRFTKGVARYLTGFTPPTEPFPDYALQKLTGTVFDADNNPVAKTVRSYRTSDGLLIDQSVSDATTGAFELRATDTSEHFVVVHDDTKNALVYDHIVPVI